MPSFSERSGQTPIQQRNNYVLERVSTLTERKEPVIQTARRSYVERQVAITTLLAEAAIKYVRALNVIWRSN